jgi:hypothetical protein
MTLGNMRELRVHHLIAYCARLRLEPQLDEFSAAQDRYRPSSFLADECRRPIARRRSEDIDLKADVRLMPAIQQPPIDFQYIALGMDHDQLAKNCTDVLCKTVQLSGPLTDHLLDAMMYAVTSLAKSEVGEEGAAEMPSILAAI